MTSIRVVAAIIIDKNNQVLVSKRKAEAHLGGLWEFPGGKIEHQETALQALNREIKEELDIAISAPELFHFERHNYAQHAVKIEFYWVEQFSGVAVGLASDAILWADRAMLQQLDFPAANQMVLEKIHARLKAMDSC